MNGEAEVFLDTNIILYAAGGAAHAPEKNKRSLELLTEDFGLSTQVLAEFFVNATRKGSKPLTADEARNWVTQLARKPCQTVDTKVVRDGIDIAQRYQTSYWDGAIIAAAERLGCKKLYSEDLNHGQAYGSVTVINPFL